MSFQEIIWKNLPDTKKNIWKNKETLTLLEFAMLLSNKEPPLQDAQLNATYTYPKEFCELIDELSTLANSSIKSGTLTEHKALEPGLFYDEDDYLPDKFYSEYKEGNKPLNRDKWKRELLIYYNSTY